MACLGETWQLQRRPVPGSVRMSGPPGRDSTFPLNWIAHSVTRSPDQLLQVNLICDNEERVASGH